MPSPTPSPPPARCENLFWKRVFMQIWQNSLNHHHGTQIQVSNTFDYWTEIWICLKKKCEISKTPSYWMPLFKRMLSLKTWDMNCFGKTLFFIRSHLITPSLLTPPGTQTRKYQTAVRVVSRSAVYRRSDCSDSKVGFD